MDWIWFLLEHGIARFWACADLLAMSGVDLSNGLYHTHITVRDPMQGSRVSLEVVLPRVNCDGDLICVSQTMQRQFSPCKIRGDVSPCETAIGIE